MHDQLREWTPFVSPLDPCKPVLKKTYVVPPNHMIGFQPANLPQFSPEEALKYGTLWPAFYSPYEPGWGN